MQALLPFFHFPSRYSGPILRDGCRELFDEKIGELITASHIKIVIIDLDNTLWSGVLEENTAELTLANFDLIRAMVNSGVMLSIASFNHYERVKSVLEKEKLWDLFIFPQISMSNQKSSMVKNILQNANLRPENAIFVDDELRNQHEVMHQIKGMVCCDPSVFFGINPQKLPFKGTQRLTEYKVLEAKSAALLSYTSNDDFLRASGISVKVLFDVKKHFDRCYELIQRTNQLNFTKNRIESKERFKHFLDLPTHLCGVVFVEDKYGNYGLSGFFAKCIETSSLDHFLFSCRLLGMGIENCVYNFLGKPSVNVVQPVSANLAKEDIDFSYIKLEVAQLVEAETQRDTKKGDSVVLKGACLFDAMLPILNQISAKTFKFLDNFSDVSRKGHTFKLLQASKDLGDLTSKFPQLFCEDDIFNHQTVVLSTAEDFSQLLWKLGKGDIYFTYGSTLDHRNLDSLGNSISDRESLQWLKQNSVYVGLIPVDQFERNLQLIANNLIGDLILVNFRNVFASDDYITSTRIPQFNEAIDRIVMNNTKVKLLDLRPLISEADLLEKGSLFHFVKKVNVEVANSLQNLINL